MADAPRGGRHWLLAITGVCLVLGALLGLQVKTRVVRGETQVGRRTSTLVAMLGETRAQIEKQNQEIEHLRLQVAKYEKEAASDKGLTKLVSEELQNSRAALGLLPMKGPGVELILDDSTMKVGDGVGDQDLFVLHDFDLIQIANELWAAGAEAISLNGQRIVTGSAVTCSGRLIQVNKMTISAPFTFLAIGSKDNLVSALSIRDGTLDRLRRLEFVVKLTPKDEVSVPAIAIAPKYQYAQPALQEQAP